MKSKKLLLIIGIIAVVLIVILAIGKKQGWLGNEGYLKIAVEKGIEREIVEIITANGKRVWIRTTGEPVKDANGKIIKVQGSFQDVNNSQMVEEDLKENRKHLTELNATKDILFSIIAHDLKAPFNSLLGFSGLLSENIRTYPIEESERIIAIINSTSKQTFALLENLLAWANTQTGQIDFKPENHKMQPISALYVDVEYSMIQLRNEMYKSKEAKDPPHY